ncbi:MAG: methyl-accepting chemotaxis protein [Candidatus Margulisbacteria bacterium]|nr:methyl-accepting chemotaxis protein [Candidatus Margulisiibacteriota bacterium]
MKLSVKLILSFLLVSVITLMVGLIGVTGLNGTKNTLRNIAFSNLPAIRGLHHIDLAQMAVQKTERSLLIPEIATSESNIKKQLENIKKYWEEAQEGFKLYEPLPRNDEQEKIWQEFKQKWKNFEDIHQNFLKLVQSGNRDDAYKLNMGEERKVFKECEKLFDDLFAISINTSQSFGNVAVKRVAFLNLLSVIFTFFGFILALGMGYITALSITRSISKIANGIADGAQSLNVAAGQIANASQSLAQGASEQAATVEETATSVDELDSMTQSNANHTVQANELMKNALDVTGTASSSMSELAASMKKISDESQNIQKIIKTIDDIAFQTNLLALNAAVEAARAGEAGAGFAVVADEVRNLATRASESARDTARLIDNSVSGISDSNKILESTYTNFNKVRESVEKVSDIIAQISMASEQQAAGIKNINIAVTELSKVTQQNAATAEETSSSSEEMSAQAEQMNSYSMDMMKFLNG